jgi:hypothetical protein
MRRRRAGEAMEVGGDAAGEGGGRSRARGPLRPYSAMAPSA